MALLGALTERLLLRPMIGEPHFAVLMLTIGLGFVLRTIAGERWGSEPKTLDLPWGSAVWRFGEVTVGGDDLAVVGGTLALCGLLYLFFRFTRLGVAMQAASQNQLAAFYVGIPVKRMSSAWSGRSPRCIAALRRGAGPAGFADRPEHGLHRHQGLRRRHRRRPRQPAGGDSRRVAGRPFRAVRGPLSLAGILGCERLRAAAGHADDSPEGLFAAMQQKKV